MVCLVVVGGHPIVPRRGLQLDEAPPSCSANRVHSAHPSRFRNSQWSPVIDVSALPFNRLMGLEMAALESGYLVSLPAGLQYTNHVGTVHAAALLAVAEAASGAHLSRHLGHLKGYVPIVRRLEANFRNPARGRVSGKASVADDVLGRTVSELVSRGRAFLTVDVAVDDEDGATALTAEVEWFIVRAG